MTPHDPNPSAATPGVPVPGAVPTAVGESPAPKEFRPDPEKSSDAEEPFVGLPPRSALRAHLPILLGSLVVIAFALLFQVTPDKSGITVFGKRLPESCLVKSTSGKSCPGCGLTRSFTTGVRLDPAAFRFHPLGPFLLLVVVAQVPYRIYRLWKGEPVSRVSKPPLWPLYAMALIALGLIATWGARMAGALPS